MYRYCARCNEIVLANQYAKHIASHRPGSTSAWRRRRALILDRDGHRCQYPGCTATQQLEVHHKDGNWRNDNPGNLETRCLAHNRHGPVAAA